MIFKNEDEKDLATIWGVQDLDIPFDEYCQSIYKQISCTDILDSKDYHFNKIKFTQPNTITAIMKKYQWQEFYKNEIECWNKNEIRPKTGNHFYTDFLVNRFNNALTPKTKEERHDPLKVLSLKNCLTGVGSIAHFSDYYSTFNNELMTQFITKYNIKSIYDYSSGWGERLITCGLAKIRYTGVDINEALQVGYKKIINDFNFTNVDTNCHDSATFEIHGTYDTAFSSPPYFGREIYTETGAENLAPDEFEIWWDTLIKNCKEHIKLFAYQIDDKHAESMDKKLIENGFELIEVISSNHQVSPHMVKANTSLDHKYRDNQERLRIFKKVDDNTSGLFAQETIFEQVKLF